MRPQKGQGGPSAGWTGDGRSPTSAITFSVTLLEICAATECPTCAHNKAAPLFSDWMQAERICCHQGDTDWESQVSSMATAGKVQKETFSFSVFPGGPKFHIKHCVKTKFPSEEPVIFLNKPEKLTCSPLFSARMFHLFMLLAICLWIAFVFSSLLKSTSECFIGYCFNHTENS